MDSEQVKRPTRIKLLGVAVDDLTLAETLALVDVLVSTGEPHQQVSLNVLKVVAADGDTRMRELILGCDVINADGQPIVWVSHLLGHPLRERVAGIDLMNALIDRAGERGHRLYFLGGRPEVLAEVVRRVTAAHPTAVIAGSRDGYWKAEEEPAVVEAIAAAKPDILFVALGSPAKELFLARWKAELRVPFAMGVGGSFDVYAGLARRAPRFMQRAGLEWLYRLVQEPRRLIGRYLRDAPKFAWLVLKAWLRPKM